MDVKPGYKKTETGIIPDDWEVFAVREKGQVLTGKALAANAPGKKRPYLRTKNVFDGRIEVDDVLTMPMTDAQFEQFRVQRGDVLLNEGQSLELVGRCAMYNDEYSEPCAMQNALLRFRAGEGTDAAYATYLFRHCQQTGVFARIALQTTSVAHLGSSRFERLRLPWPLLKREQQAIATALSDVDALLGALERLIAKKRDLKQAAMQQLLTGQKRLPGFEVETGTQQTELGILPKDWALKQIQNVCRLINGRGFKPHEWQTTGLPIIRIQNLNGSEEFNYYSGQYDSKILVEHGQLLFAWSGSRGTSFGPHVWRGGKALLNYHTWKVVIHESCVDPGFLVHAFRQITSYIEDRAHGASALVHTQKWEMEKFPIAIPLNIQEQTAIASVLSDMDAELTALEQRLAKTRALKQGMMQELLTGRTRLI